MGRDSLVLTDVGVEPIVVAVLGVVSGEELIDGRLAVGLSTAANLNVTRDDSKDGVAENAEVVSPSVETRRGSNVAMSVGETEGGRQLMIGIGMGVIIGVVGTIAAGVVVVVVVAVKVTGKSPWTPKMENIVVVIKHGCFEFKYSYTSAPHLAVVVLILITVMVVNRNLHGSHGRWLFLLLQLPWYNV